MKFIILLFILSFHLLHSKATSILSIHSYNDTYPWTKHQNDGFKKAISSDVNINPSYSTEYMDTKRKRIDCKYETKFLSYLEEKYSGYKPELIYITDDNALNFARQHIHKIFPKTPIIYSGVNNQSAIEKITNSLYTGLLEKKEILPNLELIKRLFPYEAEILLIGDASTTANTIHEKITSDSFGLNIKITHVNINDFQTAMKQIKEYNGKLAILSTVGGFHTNDTEVVQLNQVLRSIVNTGLITFVMEDIYIQDGVVGGYVVDGFNTGYEAGKLALKMLSNPTIKLNTSYINSNRWVFDIQALKKLNIKLPEDVREKSKLLNQPKSFYQANEKLITYLLLTMSLIITLGIIVLLYFLYNRETIKHEETKNIASTDNLTGAYNRHKFEELYALESERARRFQESLSIILIDIDFFKDFNDTYGHDIGDQVLIEITNTLRKNARQIDILSRWGGEEFLILCPNTNLSNAKLLAEKLRQEVEKIPIDFLDNPSISISLGVSEFQKADTLKTLFKRADQGLYFAKHNGRNQVGIIADN